MEINKLSENANVDRNIEANLKGPFGLVYLKKGDWADCGWDYYVKSDRTPSNEQFEFAFQISELAKLVRDTERNALSESIMQDLFELFSAALVYINCDDLSNYRKLIDPINDKFYGTHLTKILVDKISRPIAITAIYTVAFLILAFSIDSILKYTQINNRHIFPAQVIYLLFMLSGTMSGRVIFLGSIFLEGIRSMENYNSVSRQISITYIVTIIDVFISSIAFVVLSSGFITVVFGSTDPNNQSGFSSSQINSNSMIAFGFGVLVGIARTEFIKRLMQVARSNFS